MDPEPELRNIMRFFLGMKDITGTNAERRIKEVIQLGHKATQSTYKLKTTTFKFNAQAKRYTDAQVEKVKTRLSEMIHTFGYAKHPSMPDNPTGFFDYPEDDPMQKRFNYFRE